LADPTVEEDRAPVAAAEAAEEAAPAEPVEEEVETVTAEEVRESDEDFATNVEGEERPGGDDAEASDDDDDGLSDLEKALLVGLGAVAVGSLLDNGQEVVANSGDRVVTRAQDGDYVVYRDDDALLRQEGATVRTQTFDDGSTRTIVERGDGTQIVTVRDAQGRVLRRARVLEDGTQVVLLDDTEQAEPVDVRLLREQAPVPEIVSADEADEETLRRVLAQPVTYDPGRRFTLRQIREIAAVRNLVPGIDLDAVTFASGSAAIPPDQLGDLVDLGLLIEEALDGDPSEVFLIEGHTDAVGSEAFNLALSDRRAETVALALTENFAIPPENLVVQGYGEEFLKVPTLEDEQENRRATIRRITPLLRT
jgi:outer membrane protein OmpA-like peptidoglycan-associated protein